MPRGGQHPEGIYRTRLRREVSRHCWHRLGDAGVPTDLVNHDHDSDT